MTISIIQDSYGTLLCSVIIFCYLFINRKKYGKKLIRLFMITVCLALIETIAGSAERYIANSAVYHPMRLVLSWACYCVAPGILLSVAETIMRRSRSWKRWLVAVPEIINILVTTSAFFGPWCFSMEASKNHFVPGPLIFVPRYSIIIYLIIVIAVAFVNVRKSRFECITVLIIATLITINYVDEIEFGLLGNVRELTIAISILAYFMHFLSEHHIDEVNEINVGFVKSEEKRTREMLDQSIETLAYTIDAKDRYTKGHSSRVAKYARMIGKITGKNEEECRQIYLCGLLHDIGKISVSSSIINKPGRLSTEEYEIIKKHTTNGAVILEKMRDIPYLQDGAKYHHERYDGTGYPSGLKGEEIPEIARIIAVADSYDAMTSYRSYRTSMAQTAVKEEIWRGIGTQFDPLFAKIMISLIDADIYYDMREKTGEQDAIEFYDNEEEVVWNVAPKEQNAEMAIMMESGENLLARFISIEDRWANPCGNIEVTGKTETIRFHSVAKAEATHVWNAPSILVYSSDDGVLVGKNYDELGVFNSAGYSWKAGSADYEYSSFVKNDAFANWDNWIEQNKAGMDYFVDFSREGNEIILKIYNDLLTMDAHLFLLSHHKEKVYLTVSGELCDVSDLKRC